MYRARLIPRRSGHDQAIHRSHPFSLLVVSVPGGHGSGRRVHDGKIFVAGRIFVRERARLLLDGRDSGNMRHGPRDGNMRHGDAGHVLLQRRSGAIPAIRGGCATSSRFRSTRADGPIDAAAGFTPGPTSGPCLPDFSGNGHRPVSTPITRTLLHVPHLIPT